MAQFNREQSSIVGQSGSLSVPQDDEVTRKLLMLIEGECEGAGPLAAASKHGFSKQRYFQLREILQKQGAAGLVSQKRGPKSKSRRTDDIIRQIIRYRFLDPQVTPEVIAQKLRQLGHVISSRSVERVIADFGLQKKTPSPSSRPKRR